MQNNLSENLSKWDEISAYSQWMFSLYEQYIGKRVVDIGCGIGTMTAYYIDGRELVVGVDIFQNQIDLLNKRFREKGNFKGILLDIMSEDTEELKKYKFDTVVCINTLEHLENDELAILKMGDVISAGGGYIIILVPAFSKLYCHLDKNVSHYRRYDRGALKRLAAACGLEVVENKYFNLMGIIPYYLKGHFSKDKGGSFSTDLTKSNSRIYNFASKILCPIERHFPPHWGLSEIIILKK